MQQQISSERLVYKEVQENYEICKFIKERLNKHCVNTTQTDHSSPLIVHRIIFSICGNNIDERNRIIRLYDENHRQVHRQKERPGQETALVFNHPSSNQALDNETPQVSGLESSRV